jgi:hypothetical protein
MCHCFKLHVYSCNPHLSVFQMTYLLLKYTSIKLFLMTCNCWNLHVIVFNDMSTVQIQYCQCFYDMSTDEIHICQSVSNDMFSVEICICQVFLMTCLLFKSTSSKCFWWHVVTYCLFNFYHLITFILSSLITYHMLEKSIQVGI